MKFIIALIAICACATGWGQSTQPTSKPSVESLHADAVRYMRMRQWNKAGPLIDRVFASKTVLEHDRAVIMNHAMMDVQRGNFIRAAKDLSAWYSVHPGKDEVFVGLLGAALDRAGTSPRVTSSPAYMDGRALCDRLSAELSPPQAGLKRWGGRWLSPDEYRQKQQELSHAKQQVINATREVDSAAQDVVSAKAEFDEVNRITAGTIHNHRDRLHGSREFCDDCIRIRRQQERVAKARAKWQEAEGMLGLKRKALERAEATIPRAEWPLVMEPVEPSRVPPTTQGAGTTTRP